MAAKPKPLFIYINGYPGVGKLTVGKALCLIDATSKLFERSMPEYQPLRQKMRRLVLDAISSSISTKDVTWIFTDQQSSDGDGSLAARDYHDAAKARESTFVSIILTCDIDENKKRLVAPARGGANTKLTDLDILSHIRDMEDIFHFGGPLELEIDVTHTPAEAVAGQIKDFIGQTCTKCKEDADIAGMVIEENFNRAITLTNKICWNRASYRVRTSQLL